MLVTEDGIVIDVSELQSSNAYEPMPTTLSPAGETEGITISVSVHVPRPLTQQVPSPFEVKESPSLGRRSPHLVQTLFS